MAPPKQRIRKALSDAHLRGIGQVAATWADLELTIMILIVKEAGTTQEKTLAMIAGNGLVGWMDILKRLLISNEKGWLWDDFLAKKMQTQLEILHGQRNNIVHASWNIPKRENKLHDVIDPLKTPPVRATGLGIKKKGKELIVTYDYSAADMRAIAKQIEAMRLALIAWSSTLSPAQRTQLLAQALKDYKPPRRSRAKPKTPS